MDASTPIETTLPAARRTTLAAKLAASPILHVLIAMAIVAAGWTIATHFDAWTGLARHQVTIDAALAADITPLSAQIAGTVLAVEVNDNQRVVRGEVLARIDPAIYQADLDLAVAVRDAAAADLDALADRKAAQHAVVDQAAAAIEAAEAENVVAKDEADRQRTLAAGKLAGTVQKSEEADAAAKQADAALRSARAALAQQQAIEAELEIETRQLGAALAQADAQVRLATTNLGYTVVASPVDGVVGTRQVKPGQLVTIGTRIITVVPLPNVWVVANFKETQLTNMRKGDEAKVTVDAFPSLSLTGHVDSWSPGTGSVFALLPPDNATGNFTKVVQRVPVKIMLDAAPSLDDLLRPGMSVEVSVDTGARGPDEADPPAASHERRR